MSDQELLTSCSTRICGGHLKLHSACEPEI